MFICLPNHQSRRLTIAALQAGRQAGFLREAACVHGRRGSENPGRRSRERSDTTINGFKTSSAGSGDKVLCATRSQSAIATVAQQKEEETAIGRGASWPDATRAVLM